MLALAASLLVVAVGGGMPPRTEIVDGRGRLVRVVDRPATSPQASGARWSPDGSRLFWIDDAGVHVSRADGRGARLVVSKAAGCSQVCYPLTAAWSPGGRSLLVGGVGRRTNRLVRVDVASGRIADVVKPARFTEYSVLGSSPDGSRVAYVRSSGDPGTGSCCAEQLVVADPGGGHRRVLFAFGDPIHDGPAGSWSPDGRSIAFTSDGRDPHDPRFAVVDVATGAVRTLRAFEPYTAPPVWSPDSQRLAVGSTARTVTLSVHGGAVRTVDGPGVPLAWTRRSGLLVAHGIDQRAVDVSRDGRARARLALRMPGGLQVLALDARP